jgi:hypothetical protein
MTMVTLVTVLIVVRLGAAKSVTGLRSQARRFSPPSSSDVGTKRVSDCHVLEFT